MCDCIANASNMLREHNASLMTTMLSKPERVVLETFKIDTRKRGKPPRMVATCCPFCGERYEPEPATPSSTKAA